LNDDFLTSPPAGSNADVEEICNYLDALAYARAYLASRAD
jgi:hypothetical protein